MNRPEKEPRTTRLAHEATEYASRIGKGPAIADAIFRAHWQEGRDIGRIEVICDIALSVGLDPVEVRQVLTERSLQAEVESSLQLAQRYGITSVPTFIIGNRFMVRGLTSEEHLLKAIRACRGEGLIQLEE